VCQTCGTAFIKHQNKVYCSKECRDNRPLDGQWKNCRHCGESFYICISHVNDQFFCSRKCRLRYKGPSSIEQLLINELNNQKTDFEFQYQVGKYVIDIAFPKHRLAVEADGIYWHSLPENIERDNRKDNFLTETGWKTLRLPGDEIRSSPQNCVVRIINYIKELQEL